MQTRVFVNLVEFPYPSAEGLHVGHVFRYSGVDAYGRYMRMRGRQVFQPIGFDAFGIHTENYALKVERAPGDADRARPRPGSPNSSLGWEWRGTGPVRSTPANPTTTGGRSGSWLALFEAGLMYQAEAPVVWCPSCLTVLAREQTEDDGTVCERCGTAVIERVMKQWFLRITDVRGPFARRARRPGLARASQAPAAPVDRRSEGREIDFGDLTVFTTRPDTLAGGHVPRRPRWAPGRGPIRSASDPPATPLPVLRGRLRHRGVRHRRRHGRASTRRARRPIRRRTRHPGFPRRAAVIRRGRRPSAARRSATGCATG